MVVEPGLGASLRNCALRLQGSVVGACFGFTALALTAQAEALPRDALLVTAYSLWTFGCAFVRAASATVSYAGLVAAFTPALMLLANECGGIGSRRATSAGLADGADCELRHLDASSLALDRIQFTLAGIVCALAASVLVFPVDAPRRVHEQLAACLVELRATFEHTAGEWLFQAVASPQRGPLRVPRARGRLPATLRRRARRAPGVP